MPWVGDTPTRTDGTRTGPTVWDQAAVSVEFILSADHDTHDQDLASMIGLCLHRGGANAVTADISWGGFKITNLGDGTLATDAATKGQMDTADSGLQTQIDGKIGNVVEDTTPQLGGNLDVNGQQIVSVSNGDIDVTADGTGNISMNALGGGALKLQGLTYPAADGTNGQVMTTDGSGNVTFEDAPNLLSEIQNVLKADTYTTSSTAWGDVTGVTLTFTDVVSTDEFLIQCNGMLAAAGSGTGAHLRMMRDTTPIFLGTAVGSRIAASASIVSFAANGANDHFSIVGIDKPAATGTVVYKLQMRSGGGNASYVGRTALDLDDQNYGRVPTMLTVTKISG